MAALEVTNISVRLKLTREIKPGTFKSVELGASALITPEEAGDWQRAHRDLYDQVRAQLNAVWLANGSPNGTHAK